MCEKKDKYPSISLFCGIQINKTKECKVSNEKLPILLQIPDYRTKDREGKKLKWRKQTKEEKREQKPGTHWPGRGVDIYQSEPGNLKCETQTTTIKLKSEPFMEAG